MLQAVVWILFFFSGACGLIYEVLWCRLLGLIFGNTVHSMSAVLTAFMGGLALGSYFAGRLCDRLKRPLLTYGCLEFFIGLYCAFLPWLLSDHGPIVPIYRNLYGDTGGYVLPAARFLISSALLIVPTCCMGATLPVLAQFLMRSNKGLGRTVGTLYAVNSFGAAAGALAAGFILLPELGKLTSNWIAVSFNLLLGAAAIFCALGKRDLVATPVASSSESVTATYSPPEPFQVPVSPLALNCCVIIFGVTGFAAMATQIGWTRAISLGTGSSTYAFSLIVAVFILGISFGGLWGGRAAHKSADPLTLLSTVLLLIGLFAMILSIFLGYGPLLFFFILAWGSNTSWGTMLALQALGISILIIGPTFLMGATLPLTLQVAARTSADAGRTTGSVYAVNTAGSILGSFFGGLLILPWLGIQMTLAAMALLYAAAGLVLFSLSASRSKKSATFTACGLGALLLLLTLTASRWDPLMMSSGMYLLRDASALKAVREFRLADALPNFGSAFQLLYHKEGAAATVTVVQSTKGLTLRVGGKPDASSSDDMTTQIGLTLIPELLHGHPEHVLIIGLGSGVSAGAALAPQSVKQVDVVEMSPEVVEASAHFKEFNELKYVSGPSPLATEKLRVIINDGRNHLLLSNHQYDVIASEPSNPWMAGVGNLFTKEAFQLAAGRLKPGGVMCQWVHSYSLSEDQFFTIVRTFGEVFPDMQLWCVNKIDFLLIGSDKRIELTPAKLDNQMREPGVHRWLERVNFDTAPEFLACFLAGKDQITAVAERAPLHTDDNMLLEFSAPRSLYVHSAEFRTTGFVPDPDRFVHLESLPDHERSACSEAIDRAFAARQHMYYSLDHVGNLDDHMQAAYVLSPHQYWASEIVRLKLSAGETIIRAAASSAPNDDRSALRFARRLVALGQPERALASISTRGAASKLLIEASISLSKHEYENAIMLATNASGQGADPIACTEIAARSLLESGHPQDGMATIEQLLQNPVARTDSQTSALWLLHGTLAKSLGKTDTLVQSLLLSISLSRNEAALTPFGIDGKEVLARILLNAASTLPPELKSLAAEWRHQARRVSREIVTLEPLNPNGWELLCRSFLALKENTEPPAQFELNEAEKSFRKLQRLCTSEPWRVPADLTKEFK